MSREFKFRVYSFVDKEFIYFDIYDYPQGIAGGVSETQQFTGLKDKYDNPIYEGDIVKIDAKNHSTILGQVIFYDYGWVLSEYSESSIPFCYLIKEEIEVVGNIFEHNDLLK